MSFARLSSRVAFALIASFSASIVSQSSHAQTCPFDDGNSTLAVEGLILTRYALGITGAPLVASTGINAVDAPTVETAINCPSCGLNITGNATLTVADATIISRKLAGFSGDALTDGLALGSGTRNTPAAVQSFLLSGCGATGGTVTSITAGSGLTGGTITGSGTIAVNTAVIQNRVSGTCAVGSSIRVIAADGSVTCQTDTTGGSGSVTSVASGTGLSGGPITATGTLSIANPYRLPQSCANGQLAKYNTTTQLWECAADNGGGGTVTSVGAGIGINGGPVTTSGTLSIAPSFRLPQSCLNGQYTRYNNAASAWECVTPTVVTAVATGPGLTGGPITSTGIVGLATTQLLPTTACATNQIIKWNGTAWACASEAIASGGTVSSVATGPGLTGGPITGSGTINLAATQLLPTIACTTDQIAKWSGTAWVCAPPPPSIPNCIGGQVVGFDLNGGGVRCVNPPQNITVLAAAGSNYSSIKVSADGKPVISYGALTNGNSLHVVRCFYAACTQFSESEVDSTTNAGNYNSLAIGTDGFPVISYSGSAAPGALMVAKCLFVDCNSNSIAAAATLTAVDVTAGAVRDTSIAIGNDGFPVISYNDAVNLDLKVAKCTNADCTASIITTVDSSGTTGEYTSIAVPADGLPVISYIDRTNNDLKVAKCSNAACTASTLFVVDGSINALFGTAIAISTDGFPVISYRSATLKLKVAKCTNAACTTSTQTIVDTGTNSTGQYSSIAVPADGLPVISYIDDTAKKLKVAKCSNAACTAATTTVADDVSQSSFRSTSIAIGADGLPIISYFASNALRVLKCSNVACANP
jgi:hypothetical protein